MEQSTQEIVNAHLEEELEITRNLISASGLNYIRDTRKGYDLLEYAISTNSTEIAKLLLTRGTVITNSFVETLSNTPIHLAVINDKIEIISMLLERGANINTQNRDGIDPDQYSIENYKKKNRQAVQYLISLAANGNPLATSTLWLSVVIGDIKLVKVVLESGTNVDTTDSNGEVLNAAVVCDGEQYSEIIEILLQNGFTVNSEHVNDPQFYQAAVIKGYLNIVEALLKYGADVNMQFGSLRLSPLTTAIINKQEQIVKLLISYAADLNAKSISGKTPIFYAIKNADLNMMKLLLNNRAIAKATPELLNIAQRDVDVNASDIDGETPLHYVTDKNYRFRNSELIGPHEYNPYEEIVKLLLNRGANINAVTNYGIAPFELAIKEDNKKIVEALLENVDVNSTVKDEMTPLHCSVQLDHVVITKMLLSKGANVNAKLKKDNWTPLHFAVNANNKPLIEILLRCGARVDCNIISDIKSHEYSIFYNPLANGGILDILEVLLENGADINSRNECDGETELFNAVRFEDESYVTAILKLGADINIQSKFDDAPLDLADSQITIILHRHIAKLKAANLYVSKPNLISFSKNNEMRDFQNECNEEISRMKSEYIANTNASFYNILSRDASPLARNKDIVQALELNDYKIKFPIYASMIECNFKRGERRKMLLDGSLAFLGSISNNIPNLPYNCNEKILSYLSDQDLRDLMVNFRNGNGREELLEQGYRYFHFLFINIPEFSYGCTEKIFSFLSNDDLRNLVEACKPAKLCNSTFPPLKRPDCDLRSFTPRGFIFRRV